MFVFVETVLWCIYKCVTSLWFCKCLNFFVSCLLVGVIFHWFGSHWKQRDPHWGCLVVAWSFVFVSTNLTKWSFTLWEQSDQMCFKIASESGWKWTCSKRFRQWQLVEKVFWRFFLLYFSWIEWVGTTAVYEGQGTQKDTRKKKERNVTMQF